MRIGAFLLSLAGLLTVCASASPAPNDLALHGPARVRPGDDAVFVVSAPYGLSDARTLIVYPQPPALDGASTAPWTVAFTLNPSLRQRVSVISPSERSLILAPPLTEPAPVVIAYFVVHIPASAEEGSTAHASVRWAVLASPSAEGLESLVEWAQGADFPDTPPPHLLSRGEAVASAVVSGAPVGLRDRARTAYIGDYLVKPGAVFHVPIRLGHGIRRAAVYAFVRLTAVPAAPKAEPLRVVDVTKPLLPASVLSVTADAPADPNSGAVSATIEVVSPSTLWPADPFAVVALQMPAPLSQAAYSLRLSASFTAEDGAIVESQTRDGTVFPDAVGRLSERDYVLYADIDGDDEITTGDSAAAVQYVLGLSTPTPDELLAADVWPSLPDAVGDGRVSLEDVREILHRALGMYSTD